MKTHHADNVRIKHKYLGYLKEAKGHAEASLDSVAQALDRFENYTHFRDFKAFHPEQAKAFKVHLTAQVSSRSGERLTQATLNSTLRHLRAFFHWLAGQPGYRSKLTYADADYFNLPANDARIAKTRRAPPVPTLEQIIHVLATMPSATDVELRNRALVAFAILTGARDGALASLKLKHVDLEQGHVFQDGRNVATKRGKSINTWFFPVGEQPLRIVTDWIAHLRGALLWGNDDPLLPKTRVGVGGTSISEKKAAIVIWVGAAIFTIGDPRTIASAERRPSPVALVREPPASRCKSRSPGPKQQLRWREALRESSS
jgi:site-specific recombinase XerD